MLEPIFGFGKARDTKHHNRLCAHFARVNLYLHLKRLIDNGSPHGS